MFTLTGTHNQNRLLATDPTSGARRPQHHLGALVVGLVLGALNPKIALQKQLMIAVAVLALTIGVCFANPLTRHYLWALTAMQFVIAVSAQFLMPFTRFSRVQYRSVAACFTKASRSGLRMSAWTVSMPWGKPG